MTGGFDRQKFDGGRLDWLAEIGGALALALGAGFAALKLAPGPGWPLPASSLGAFALGWLAMRAVPPAPRRLAIAHFELLGIDAGKEELLLDRPLNEEELLLDQPLVSSAAVAELLLEDALPAPSPDSRVVRLFAAPRLSDAGQIKVWIDRHLAAAGRPVVPVPDASDALAEALAELRRSLRQA